MTPAQLPEFDLIWKKHGMAKALSIARVDIQNLALLISKAMISNDLNHAVDDRALASKLLQNECFKLTDEERSAVPGCDAQCVGI